jgi:uncharacterized protein
MRSRVLLLLLGVALAPPARAAEVIPPAPRDHFNDYAGLVRPDAARQLNAELAQFERDTSNQLVVAIFPKMPSSSSVEDYTVRVAQAWGVGRRDKKNGAVLFIFSQDRQLYIQVGYGLEGALPDALCKRIIADEITPRFRAGDFTGGVTAGVHALMAAARGEYRGTGRTAREAAGNLFFAALGIMIVLGLLFGRRRSGRRFVLYNGRGQTIWTSSSTWGGGGGGWSGGGGGTFSGGGGSFGGGGAGGRW